MEEHQLELLVLCTRSFVSIRKTFMRIKLSKHHRVSRCEGTNFHSQVKKDVSAVPPSCDPGIEQRAVQRGLLVATPCAPVRILQLHEAHG